MKRVFWGIELNEKYVREITEPRLNNIEPLFEGGCRDFITGMAYNSRNVAMRVCSAVESNDALK
jgi:hypothetical protein